MDDFFRKKLERYAGTKNLPQEDLTDVGFISLRKTNSERVKPGMFWYEDDTVSVEFSTAKKLKSLVLFVKDDVVYGDSFHMRYMLGDKICSYMKKVETDLAREFQCEMVYRPEVEDLQRVYQNLFKINGALKRIGKHPWSKELFWAQAIDRTSALVVDMFDGDFLTMFFECQGAYFRPMVVQKLL